MWGGVRRGMAFLVIKIRAKNKPYTEAETRRPVKNRNGYAFHVRTITRS